MQNETVIRDFSGKITRRVINKPNGDKEVRDFYGKILGRYDSTYNVTRDFYGRVVSKGDTSCGL